MIGARPTEDKVCRMLEWEAMLQHVIQNPTLDYIEERVLALDRQYGGQVKEISRRTRLSAEYIQRMLILITYKLELAEIRQTRQL